MFDNLGALKVSDQFLVGQAAFEVTRVRPMSRQEVRDLSSGRGAARVVLITCGDRSATSVVYASRILVLADKA